jgi:ABC-type nitrate/sulfonate/bicarbonate transport system ATPase subunit
MGSALSVHIASMKYPEMNGAGNLVEDLSFEVPADGVISLLGRSGAGKTTLLRMIAGLERRFRGRITLDGKEITKPGRSVQVVFQDYRLLPWKTVYQNIEFATARNGSGYNRTQIERWLEIVGLQHRKDAWPKHLSGGEEGRVAFARAFVDQPRLLLLDEPFRGLDLATKFDLQDHLFNALRAQKTTVIIVSHSVEDAVFMSDAVHVLSDSPLRVERTFEIDIAKPRQRGDQRLSELSARITEYLATRRRGARPPA